MALGSRGILSVVELVFYLPCLFGAIYICSRHGFARSSGWIYTLILCLVRILGSACYLAVTNSPSKGLLEATLILEFIGISPLLFATLGLLSRYVDWTNIHNPGPFSVKMFRMLQLLIFLGMILSIAGGTSSVPDNSDGSAATPAQPSTESEAGVILYVVAFVAIVLILIASLPKLKSVPAEERMIAIAVAVAAPFIAVRILYAILTVFLHDSTFNSLNGSVLVKGFMAVLEEFFVVVIYILLGLRLDRLSEEQQGEILSRPWKTGKEGKDPRRDGRRVNRGDQLGRVLASRLNDRVEARLGMRFGEGQQQSQQLQHPYIPPVHYPGSQQYAPVPTHQELPQPAYPQTCHNVYYVSSYPSENIS